MANPVRDHAKLHRRQALQNGTKLVYFTQEDIGTIIQLKESGQYQARRPTAATDSLRRRGARASVEDLRAVGEPVEPKGCFTKKV